MEYICNLFRKYNERNDAPENTIEFFDDGSGQCLDVENNDLFTFGTIKELKEKLTEL